MNWLFALLAGFGVLASGDCCLRLARIRPANGHLRAGLALAAGLALLLISLYAPFALTGRVHFWPATAVLALGLCAGLIVWTRTPRGAIALRPWLAWAAVALLLGLLGSRGAFASYDERAIYGIKAKALLCERDVHGAVFQDVYSVNFHRDYPLGLPLVMAWAGELSGGVPRDASGARGAPAAQWVQRYGIIESYATFAALWPLGILLLAWGGMRDLGLRTRARLWLVPVSLPLALVVPQIGGPSWSWSGADLPLALFVGAAAVLFREATRESTGRAASAPAAAAGVLIATGLLLKQDALLSIVAFAAALAMLRARLGAWLALGLGATAAWASVAWAGRAIPEPLLSDRYFESLTVDALGTYVARVPLLAERAVAVLASQRMIAFWAGALFIGVVYGWRRGGVERALALWVAVHVALTLGVFLVTPHNLDWHISTALTRVMSHSGVPAGALLVAALAQFARRRLALVRAPAPESSLANAGGQ